MVDDQEHIGMVDDQEHIRSKPNQMGLTSSIVSSAY